MDSKDIITTLVTLLAGAFLNEVVVTRWRRRQQNKEDLNAALAELLEIHFDLVRWISITEAFEKLPFPDEHRPLLRKKIIEVLPPIESDLHTRYANAVTAISKYDPILGFKLRSRDTIRAALNDLLEIGNNVPGLSDFVTRSNTHLAKEGVKSLNELLPQIAARSSWRLARRIRKGLRKTSYEIPPEAADVMNAMRALAAKFTVATTAPLPSADLTVPTETPAKSGGHS